MIWITEDWAIDPDKIEWFRWIDKGLVVRFAHHVLRFDKPEAQQVWDTLQELVGDE